MLRLYQVEALRTILRSKARSQPIREVANHSKRGNSDIPPPANGIVGRGEAGSHGEEHRHGCRELSGGGGGGGGGGVLSGVEFFFYEGGGKKN